jgi:hypothetical protein
MVYFRTKKSQFGYILEGLGVENFGIFMTIWNILRPFGKFYGSLVLFRVIWYYFSRFGTFGPSKIWQPCSANTFIFQFDPGRPDAFVKNAPKM